MNAQRKPTAYGMRVHFARGMTADVESPHQEWLDEAAKRINAHDDLVDALRGLMEAFGGVTTHPQQEAWNAARAALAKAEGK